MKANSTDAIVVSSALIVIISISTIVAAAFGSAFAQAPVGGNITAINPNATSMEANVTGAYANNANQSAPTAANTTAANASQSNASLSS